MMLNNSNDILNEMYGCEDLKPINSKQLAELKKKESEALLNSINNLTNKFTQWW